MKSFRNLIEYALVMKMSKISICQQDDLNNPKLEKDFDDEYPCHIYFICARPRVVLCPEKCEFGGFQVKLVFKIQKGFKFEEKELILTTPEDTSDFELKSDFPHSKFFIFKDGKQILSAKSSLYYFMHLRDYKDHMNSELLYIGQSFGANGERKSPDRLKSHSTLQSIYSEAIQNNPDKEIWINLLSFERMLFTSFDGINKSNKREDDEVEKVSNVLHKFMNNKLNEKQIINFTEAALIKYFKPRYNIIYKDKFPDPAHTSYSECYDLDVNSVAIELDTEPIATKIFTDSVKPQFINLGSFTLKSREKRKSFFDILDNSLIPNKLGNINIQ